MKNFVIALSLLSGISINAADAVKGKALYARCISCHGSNGEGKESQKAPRIAGQFDWYIYSSLVQFKSKERVNATMYPFIKNLSDQDYQDLAAYVSTLK